MTGTMRGVASLGLAAALTLLAAVAMAPSAEAAYRPTESDFDPEMLRIDEQKYLGTRIDREMTFVGADGKEFTLAKYGEVPVILVLSYYSCDGFCPAFNAELAGVLQKVVDLSKVKPGVDFKVLTVSFDNNDTPESARFFATGLHLPAGLAENWDVAVAKDAARIEELTSSLGYKFFWSRADRQFFHPNASFFVSPEQRVVRILHNRVAEPKDMELAIIDSKFDRLQPSEIANLALSLCYSYNYKDGKYGLNYPAFIAFGSLFTGISAFVFAAGRLKKKQKHARQARG